MAQTVPEGEYETQFFGFSPALFVQGVRRLIDDRLVEGIDRLDTNLAKIPEEIISPDEISHGINLLREQTDANLQKTWQKLESYVLGSVMKVPANMVLPSDLDQQNPVTASDLAVLEKDIESLQTQLKNERVFRAKLREETRDLHKVLDEQQKMLEEVVSEATMSRLEEVKEKMQFAQSNVDKMLALSGRIRDTSATMDTAGVSSPAGIIATQCLD